MKYQDPTFNKETYWERRQKGWRGQEGIHIPKGKLLVTGIYRGEPKLVGAKSRKKNGKRYRKAIARGSVSNV